MSRKKKKELERQKKEMEARGADIAYGTMNPWYPNPVAPASTIVQLPPIVQPIVMVPLSSQQQPVATFEDEDYDDDDDFDF